jgi:hypothetical protein
MISICFKTWIDIDKMDVPADLRFFWNMNSGIKFEHHLVKGIQLKPQF